MLGYGLHPEEIEKRLIRLRNLERLHVEQKERNDFLLNENSTLKKEVARLNLIISEQQRTIDDMKLRIEELSTMVFGKKKKVKKFDDDDEPAPPKEKILRSSDSYKRPIPREDEVTDTKFHLLRHCTCGEKMTEGKTIVYYEEDIPIPAKKIVRKHFVEKGYCVNCKKWNVAVLLPSHKVILGPNIQKYTCYLSILCRLSFTQIQELLRDIYKIHVSQGEIAKILNREAVKLRPEYERLKVKIRGEPVAHLDETGWKLLISGENSYAWVMSGAESKENIFLVGESRGGGNVEKLLGNDHRGFAITDDYNAYKKLKNHQLCFAHLIRKWRDLAQSKELADEQSAHCKMEYKKLCGLYDDLKNDRRIERHAELAEKFNELSVIAPLDPKKLATYKTTLRKNIPQYLTCLSDPKIPLTNNQAERSLRHLVLKRKVSFGSLTKRTADNLAVLLSVLMSLKQRHQGNFFGEYLGV